MTEKEMFAHPQFLELNAYRKVTQLIVALLTPAQLKTLKSRLAFDPRKLPQARTALQAFFAPLAPHQTAEIEQLITRYRRLLDAFETLLEAPQLEHIHAYRLQLSEQIEAFPNDVLYSFSLDCLELVSGLLLQLAAPKKENNRLNPHSDVAAQANAQ